MELKDNDAQKYITTLFLALSEDAVINSKKDLKYFVKVNFKYQKDLMSRFKNNEQKQGSINQKTLNSILKRLNKIINV